MKKYILMIVSSLMLVSCLDTIILPDDKTVDEDFWKTKEDVAKMVNAAYAAMASNDVVTRLIVWGDYRSDEMTRNASVTDNSVKGTLDALDEIASVNMQVSNSFANWASVYNVINRCNIVLERAEAVMNEDPNYTRSDYEADRCQMLALRSLCYFYLVRNYRDVPYVTEAYMNSSQNTQMGQTAPLTVIDRLIETMEEVANNPNCLRSDGKPVSEWRRVGWMTRDGACSLLADLYLWRASVMHTASDYQKCVEYCNKVIDSKQSQHVVRNGVVQTAYPLSPSSIMYGDLFGVGNAEESIFELQMPNNTALCQYFHKFKDNNSTDGFLKATTIFSNIAANINNAGNNVFANYDMRYYGAVFFDGGETFHIRKMVSTADVPTMNKQTRISRSFSGYEQNYIIYRLADVMLMRAEAQTELMKDTPENASDDEKTALAAENQALLQQAFNMVQAVNTRALYVDNQKDSIKWNNTSNSSLSFSRLTKNQMELIVMQERLRELCFEGKRWYDLLRYNYRHAEGIQYNRTMAEQVGGLNGDANALPAVYDEMLKLMTRGSGADADAVMAKMHSEAYLYMPVPENDINVCPALMQNPAYKSLNAFEKSY